MVATGQTWAEVKRLWTHGVKAYIGDMWNIVEFATTSLYITTYTLKFVSYFLVCIYSIRYMSFFFDSLSLYTDIVYV